MAFGLGLATEHTIERPYENQRWQAFNSSSFTLIRRISNGYQVHAMQRTPFVSWWVSNQLAMMESFVVRLQFAGICTLCEGEANRRQSFRCDVQCVCCSYRVAHWQRQQWHEPYNTINEGNWNDQTTPFLLDLSTWRVCVCAAKLDVYWLY